MKKNIPNGEKTNIFERIKAFFQRRKNEGKTLSDEKIDNEERIVESGAIISSVNLKNSESFTERNKGEKYKFVNDNSAGKEGNNDNEETNFCFENEGLNSESVSKDRDSYYEHSSLSENPIDKKEVAKGESNDVSELTPQQEFIACKNINVCVNETLVRSFVAKLIGIDPILQEYYSELKNYVLSFSGTRFRTSWQYDSIYKTKVLLSRFVIKGKSLWMYVRLKSEEVPEGTNFVTTADKKYEGLEVGLKIQGARTFKQAKILLTLACEKEKLTYSEKEKENFVPETMTEEELIEKSLIRKVITSTNPK